VALELTRDLNPFLEKFWMSSDNYYLEQETNTWRKDRKAVKTGFTSSPRKSECGDSDILSFVPASQVFNSVRPW
jgi:hypothetical protein